MNTTIRFLLCTLLTGASLLVPQGLSAQVETEVSPPEMAEASVAAEGTAQGGPEAPANEGVATNETAAPTPLPAPTLTPRTRISEVVRILADGIIRPNEITDDFVVILGDGLVEGTVTGDAVVVLGNATVNGQVKGDLVNVMGSTTLGPEAVIRGELVVVGGRLEKADTAIIDGVATQVSFLPDFRGGHFEWLSIWIHQGLLMGRPLPHDQTWAWIVAGIFLLIGLVIALVFRRAIDATVHVLENRPAAALLTGLLVFVLFGPLGFILLVSVIGILVIPFSILALKIAAIFGILALYRFTGMQFGLRARPALALIVGGLLFTVLYAIPIVGLLTLLVAAIFGTGATCLAMVQGIRRETTGNTGAPARMSPVSPQPVASMTAADPTATSAAAAATGSAAAVAETVPDRPAEVAGPLDDPLMAVRVGFWPRLGATALDFILIAGLTALTDLDWMLGYLWLGYHLAFWSWRQTTIGGIVMNLKVVRLDGQPLSFGVAAVRSLASVFSGLVVGLGFFWASWDEERQSWHDKIAGTTIVRVPKGTSLL